MSHGVPDFGQTAGVVTTYQLLDLAELAARLGSIVTFDRRGEVLALDSFEDGLDKWEADDSGTGAAEELGVVETRSGLFSAKLTGGSNGSLYAQLERTLAGQEPSKYGFEFSWCAPGQFGNVELRSQIYTGATIYTAGLRYVRSTNSLEYYDSASTWQTLQSPLLLYFSSGAWHTMKLVVDPETGLYVRALLDSDSFDLSAYSMAALTSAGAARFSGRMRAYSRSGFNDAIYFDDTILTQNEP